MPVVLPAPTVIPAKAGIQSGAVKSCRVLLDSRLRGNDGERLAVNGYVTATSHVTEIGAVALSVLLSLSVTISLAV